jgi:hypothetical protein
VASRKPEERFEMFGGAPFRQRKDAFRRPWWGCEESAHLLPSSAVAPDSRAAPLPSPLRKSRRQTLTKRINITWDPPETALDHLSASEYPEAFDAILPAFYQTVSSIGLSLVNTQSQLIDQRLDAIRLGADRGFSVARTCPSTKKATAKAQSMAKAGWTATKVSSLPRWKIPTGEHG